MFKKILSITLCSICIFMAGGAVSAQAAETTISNTIPEQMEANTLIEYIGDSNWRLVPDSDSIESVMEKVALSPDYYKEEVAKLPRKISLLPVYEEVNPSPEVGMRVQYDNWGEKEAIYVLRDGEYKEVEMLMTQVSSRLQFSETFAYNPLPWGKRKPVGTYTYGKVVPETTKKAGYKKIKLS